MPNFQGTESIILQSTKDQNVPYQFEFTVCSASTANDGAIPYGHTISSASVTCHHIDGTVVTTGIIAGSSITGFVETVWLNYPTSSGSRAGTYHIDIVPTISDGTTTYTREFSFNRLILRNL